MILSAEPELNSEKSSAVEGHSPDTPTSNNIKNWQIFAGVIVVSIVSVIIWDLVGHKIKNAFNFVGNGVPLIQADRSPIKVAPKNPGGMHVPNRGTFIYETIEGNEQEAKLERLLPPEEAPVAFLKSKQSKISVPNSDISSENSKSSDISGQSNETKKKKIPQKKPNLDATPSSDLVNGQAPPAPPQPPGSSKIDALSSSTTPTDFKILDSQNSRSQETQAKIAKMSTYQIQIAATRSESAAKSEWLRLRKAHMDILGDLGLNVTKVDLGTTKGVFFRLRLGPLVSEDAARDLCGVLKKRKVGCLVIRPNN